VNALVKCLVSLYCISTLHLVVTSVFGQVVVKCSVHYILTLRAYRAHSFHYITLGFETIFLAFSRFGVTVPRDGAEVQGM